MWENIRLNIRLKFFETLSLEKLTFFRLTQSCFQDTIFCRKESNLSHSLTVVCRRDLYFWNLFGRDSSSIYRTMSEKDVRRMEQAHEIWIVSDKRDVKHVRSIE